MSTLLSSPQSLLNPLVRHLGRQDYTTVWQNMQEFTANRDETTRDELWVVEHNPVYTLGLNGKPEHILDAGGIPVVKCDRGGQVTYHGPGQLVVYVLLDLRRRNLGVKSLVHLLEQAVMDLLKHYALATERKAGAPGVYLNGEKIAALGLRVRRGCSYHGLSLNVDMDLEPFRRINPCGYKGLKTTQVKAALINVDMVQVTNQFLKQLSNQINPSNGPE
jgi:lipoyl(octanoyl) transferase